MSNIKDDDRKMYIYSISNNFSAQAYVDGINYYFQHMRIYPIEFYTLW